jgi:hypothetical protein
MLLCYMIFRRPSDYPTRIVILSERSESKALSASPHAPTNFQQLTNCPAMPKRFCPLTIPFVSVNYELPNLQVLCFDNHTKCRGCVYAPPPFPSRHSPALIRSGSPATRHLPSQSPLESILVKVYQNKGLYLPLESTLARKQGGGGALLFSPCRHPPLFPSGIRPSDVAMRFHLSLLFSIGCALFCTHAKLNSFLFKRLRTLCEKHPGGGVLFPKLPGGGAGTRRLLSATSHDSRITSHRHSSHCAWRRTVPQWPGRFGTNGPSLFWAPYWGQTTGNKSALSGV